MTPPCSSNERISPSRGLVPSGAPSTTPQTSNVSQHGRALRDRGIVGTAPGPPAFLSSHCDSVQGMLLCHLGRWTEAERVLVGAYDAVERAMPGSAWHPPIALAELRILQGRLAEAEGLLLGRDDQIQALLPTARLHLARSDHHLARATARCGVAEVGRRHGRRHAPRTSRRSGSCPGWESDDYLRSHAPASGGAGVGGVGAVRTGADGSVEVLRERRMVLGDP